MDKKKFSLDVKKDHKLIAEICTINDGINGINSTIEHLSLKMGRLRREERQWFEKVKIKLSIINKDNEILVYNHINKEITIKGR